MTGNPRPKVSWWSGNDHISDRSFNLGSFLASHEEEGGANDPTVNETGVGDEEESLLAGSGRERVHVSLPSNSIFGRNTFSVGIADGKVLDSSPKTVAHLVVRSVDRSYAGANVTCKAHNNNISQPLIKTVTLSVYRKYYFKLFEFTNLSKQSIQSNNYIYIYNLNVLMTIFAL